MSIPLYAWLTRILELRWIMMIGLALFALSMWQFVPITHDWGWAQLLLPQACAALPSSWRCRRQ
jgi:DHA2 family multidrug resistance protein